MVATPLRGWINGVQRLNSSAGAAKVGSRRVADPQSSTMAVI